MNSNIEDLKVGTIQANDANFINLVTKEVIRGSFGEEEYSEIDINPDGVTIKSEAIFVDGVRIDGEEE